MDEGVYLKFNSVQASASSQGVGSVRDCRQRYVDTRSGVRMGGGWEVEGGGALHVLARRAKRPLFLPRSRDHVCLRQRQQESRCRCVICCCCYTSSEIIT